MVEFSISTHFKWNKADCVIQRQERMGKNLFSKTEISAVKCCIPAFNITSDEDKWTNNPKHLQLFAELYGN